MYKCADVLPGTGRRTARHRIDRRTGWGASWRLGSGGEGERGEPILGRGLNTANYRDLFVKLSNETFFPSEEECGLNMKNYRDFSVKTPTTYDQKQSLLY